MRKILAVIAAVSTIYSTSAQAHQTQNNHRHPHQQHHHHHKNGNNWALPLIGGIIIGGALAGGNNYYQEQRPYYPRPVRCYNSYAGEYWNGWEWVQTYRRVCY